MLILKIFCQKRAFVVLSHGVKHGIQPNLGSRDMGPLVTPKRLFRLFLENLSLDFVNFLSELGSYDT